MISDFRKKYFFLSNFYPCTITYKGINYSTSEAAYQAQKTLDDAERLRISRLNPEDAKSEGRKLELRKDWEEVKLTEMYNICKIKLTENPNLTKRLLETGSMVLIEGNDWNDYFWGVCGGKGENHLGKILMQIRDEIRKENKEEYV